jgi:hypothetical protein
MKKILKSVCLIAATLFSISASAQLSGAYAVPGTFTSVAAAINSLNIAGVSGPVTINVSAGYTETVTAGGFTLNSIVGASSTNTIVFQKSGVGANPILYAYAGGTATPASAVQDGIWKFMGTDYVTINGIDLNDPNTANPSTMEFGYGFFKASDTDGCQYNTIKNCTITLNRVNNVAGSGPSIEGSKGINVINATIDANITNVTVTSAAGSNSFNKFYSNTIQNCNMGIVIMGYAATTPFTLGDFGNDIGGNSTSTGNTIINYGGGGTAASEGISVQAQRDINISYNVINSNTGSGVNHAGIIRGIILNASTSANAVVSHNTVTLKPGGTTSAVTAIQNASGSTAANNTVSVVYNVITNCTYTTATTGAFNGILNSGTPAFLDISHNSLINTTHSGTGTFTGINGAGVAAVTLSMNSNTVTGNVKTGTNGIIYCMRAATASVTVNGNTITNNTIPNSSGTSACSIYGYYNISSPTYEVYTNNVVDNLSISGASTGTGHLIYGIYTNSSSSSIKEISNNRVGLLSIANTLAGGNVYGIYQSIGNTANLSKNKIYDLNCGGAAANVYGIYVNSGTSNILINNIIGNLTAPAATSALAIAGVYINGGGSANLFYNTVYINATSSATDFGTTALYASTTPSLNIRNNIFKNTSTPTGTGVTTAIRSNTVNLSTYNVASNNNCFYAGTPGANNLIFSDGTNAVQTLAVYQGAVSPREVNSISENTPFLSLVGTSPNFLHIDPVIPSLTESGAANISGITDDFDNQTRQGNSGYVGTGTAPDIGADEFSQSLPVCSGVVSASVSALTLTACSGQTISAYATGFTTGSGIVHQWKYSTVVGGPYTNVPVGPNSNNTAYSTSSFTAGVYYLVMVSTCSVGPVSATSNEISFTINPSPTASISALPLVCENATINLGGVTDIGTTYSWTGPSSFTSALQSPTITNAQVNATGQYSLITSLNGCSSSVYVHSLTVSGTTLNVINSDPNLCFGNTVTLTANTSAVSYTWANNNAQTNSIVDNPTVTTIYTVTTTNSDNCIVSRTATVTVINVTISPNNTTSCANETTTLSVNAYTPSIINWYASPTSTVSLGSGSTFTLNPASTTTVYAEANSVASGSLFTTLAGGNNSAGNMFDIQPLSNLVIDGVAMHFAAVATTTVEVWYRTGTFVGFESSNSGWTLAHTTTVNTLGTGVLTPIPGTFNINVASGQTYALYITSTNGSPSTNYTNGTALGALFSSNSDLAIYEGKGGGYFSVTFSPRNFNGVVYYSKPGCYSARTPVTLSVNPSPSVTVAQTAASVCYSTQTTFTASGASTYTWVNGPVSNTLIDTPISPSTYTVVGTDLNGCSDSAFVSMGVDPLPIISISPASATVCALSEVSYTASGASTYIWNGTTAGATFTNIPTLSTVYTVSGTDTQGCVGTETVAAVVNALPVIAVTPSSASVCAGSIVTYTASGATTYSWTSGALGANATFTAVTSGSYSVTGEDGNGCSSTQTLELTAYALPTVVISPASPTICSNESLILTGSGASNYSWMPGTSSTATIMVNPSVNSSTYTLEGTDLNNCKNTLSVTVTVDPCTGINEQNSLVSNVSLYPNPSTGLLNANFGFEGSKEINVLNSVGALVMKITTDDLTHSFDLSGYAKGVYFIRVSASGTSANYKVIIQ